MSYGRMMTMMKPKRGQGGGMEPEQGGNRMRDSYPARQGNGGGNGAYNRASYNKGPNSGGYAAMRGPAYSMGDSYDGMGEEGSEMAFRDRRGRKHYDNGRYAPTRNSYEEEDDEEGMNQIGFDMGKHQVHPHPGREMGRAAVYDNGSGGWDVKGSFGGKSGGSIHLTKEMADTWTSRMRNEDGSAGPHWTMAQIQQLQQQKKELQEFDIPELFAVMNMMYSDYCKVAKKFNVNNVDFYVGLASAWLDDKDAGEGKTAKYYECVIA